VIKNGAITRTALPVSPEERSAGRMKRYAV
jgi:hypothetical protein